MMDYFRFMLIDEVDPDLVYRLSPEQMDELTKYISDPMTASSIPDEGNKRPSNEMITSELIYYWMVALKIPFEAETWHLNRLMMLIQITNYKQQPPKKQKAADAMATFREMNEKRKKMFNTTG